MKKNSTTSKMERSVILAALISSLTATAGNPALAQTWAHQNGSLSSNGAVTIKSLSGGTYTGTQNPTGAVAKANQSAVTQPPTVIIQATAGGQVFSYKDDCYTMNANPYGTARQSIGAGRLDAATNTFTGVLALQQGLGAMSVMSMLTGMNAAPVVSTQNIGYTHTVASYCASSGSCVDGWLAPTYGQMLPGSNIVYVRDLPVSGAAKCY